MDGRDVPRSAVDLERLRPGTHLCRFYDDEHDLARGAATFVSMGLAAGDRVLYVTGDRDADQARASFELAGVDTAAAVAGEQLVIRTSEEIYGTGPLVLVELEAGFRELQARARADGLVGLRVAAEMGDAAVRFGSLEQLVHWEAMATRIQRDTGISSVCQYDRRRFTPAGLDLLAAEHVGYLPDRAPPPLARFSFTGGGIRVVGELDISNRERFIEVVEARAHASPRLELDLTDLTFMDIGTAERLFGLARRRPELGLTLRHLSPRLQRYLTLAELQHPRVTLTA